ncbi:16S rRNA (guanine(527)-N(7))-methyltransferase RsmG [Sphingobium sp. B12D2B]|uniref:16S rRNA (guanine(527)-N(7))-methyltransferase RsmG n=1 Tax=Sphingobium sp. B12D2B TaxID=2940577 RepID=UPI00222508E5|nr:16S rRNA (guanine(527)-N(7))-methyltransferase RsmG [Sphingobium sp. B12D2B]MCW2348815.1 16S rRNA (guanine527-N7)-methyltransferase [Sphingobium sp. B12D2B]
MTEEEAQAWLADRGWWDGIAGDRLRTFVGLVLEEADRQNLISAATRASIWARHIVDSAQLLSQAASTEAPTDGIWLDLGTGAGFPGLVVGCLRDAPIRLVEVRPLRVAFLKRCTESLGLDHVDVVQSKVESAGFDRPAAVITARAYAPLDRLLTTAHHLADENTIWLLPKGRSSEKELEIVRPHWQAVFHVEQSVTDAESAILTVRQLKKRVTIRATDKKPSSSRRNGNRRKAATSAGPKGQS